MSINFIPKVIPPENLSTEALWFLFYGEYLLLQKKESQLLVPNFIDLNEMGLHTFRQHYLGEYQNQHCFTAELMEPVEPRFEKEMMTLRKAYEFIGEELFTIAGKAKQLITWDKQHQFCGFCGNKTKTSKTERAKICGACNSHFYPRISPAIIVLVTRGREVLLARSPHFNPEIYSTLAGFVEPGETAEDAILREIQEEVGIKVKNIHYFSSQPWPFPHNLMLGYFAEYAEGEIKVDGNEIEDAKWFTIDNLPKLPSNISLSYHLIEHFFTQKNS